MSEPVTSTPSLALDETTSHSTRLQTTAAKSLVIPLQGGGDSVAAKSLVIPLQGGGDKPPAVLDRQGEDALSPTLSRTREKGQTRKASSIPHSVSDNLFPGDTLNVGRLFMDMFSTEIEARLVRMPGQKGGRDGAR